VSFTALIAAFAAPVIAFAAAPAAQLSLASKTFAEGATLPNSMVANVYGCTGANQAPELHWSGAPAGTKSFALTMFDPDAPAAGGFWHWVVFNIPAAASSMSAETSPKGLGLGKNGVGTSGYFGACPPPGKAHHYVFTLYALDIAGVSGVDASTTGPELTAALKGHVLAKATLTGLYGR